MEQATQEEIGKMMQQCGCGSGKMFYQCCGTQEAAVMGEKMCPAHTSSMLKDCCMANPGAHQM
mgnify:FL=1